MLHQQSLRLQFIYENTKLQSNMNMLFIRWEFSIRYS